jgi:hypothetical protein
MRDEVIEHLVLQENALVPHQFEGPQSLGLRNQRVEAEREVSIEIKAGGAMFHHSLTPTTAFPTLVITASAAWSRF